MRTERETTQDNMKPATQTIHLLTYLNIHSMFFFLLQVTGIRGRPGPMVSSTFLLFKKQRHICFSAMFSIHQFAFEQCSKVMHFPFHGVTVQH